MEREDIIRMAREAGFICLFPDEAVNGIGTIYNYNSGDEEITEMMERFAALVAAHERNCMNRGRCIACGNHITEGGGQIVPAPKDSNEQT